MLDQYSLEDREDTIRLGGAWSTVIARIERDVAPTVFDRFLRPLDPIGLEAGVAIVNAPGSFVQEVVRERYLARIQRALSDELGEPVIIELRSEPRDKPAMETLSAAISQPLSSEQPQKFKPIERYRFDTFVVGQSNRLAYAGSKAVATDPGTKYNPLFIYGPSGHGKTHLLHAIAQSLLWRDPKFSVAYVTAQQFAEEFVHALQERRIDQFRRQQRSVGVWLLDDIQFVAGKDKTQEEVFHTFNHLQQIGKQIVICSDRPPRDLFLMDERLRSRFESGLVADVQPPDTETRCAILLSKAKLEGIEIEHEVAMYLAAEVPGNIRILEGAMTKIAAQASIEDIPIDHELAKRVVESYYRAAGMAKPSFTQILDLVGKHYKIPLEEIRGISRKAPIAHARHVAVYITRQITGDSWKHIGSLFGDRDHTSMMHAYQKIGEMMSRDKDMNAVVKMLIRNVYPEN